MIVLKPKKSTTNNQIFYLHEKQQKKVAGGWMKLENVKQDLQNWP